MTPQSQERICHLVLRPVLLPTSSFAVHLPISLCSAVVGPSCPPTPGSAIRHWTLLTLPALFPALRSGQQPRKDRQARNPLQAIISNICRSHVRIFHHERARSLLAQPYPRRSLSLQTFRSFAVPFRTEQPLLRHSLHTLTKDGYLQEDPGEEPRGGVGRR